MLPDLLPIYEGAFAHVPDLPQRLRGRFSEHLASIAVYGFSKPVQDGWLGRFLHAVAPEDRAAWASEVGRVLRQLEAEAVRDLWDGWLSEYWSRLNVSETVDAMIVAIPKLRLGILFRVVLCNDTLVARFEWVAG